MDKNSLKKILFSAIEEVKPENLILKNVKLVNDELIIEDQKISLKNYENIYICGSGKASIGMTKGLKKVLNNSIKKGIIISNANEYIEDIEVLTGSHPLPDESSLNATEKLCKFLSSLKENDFFIYLLSGGTSALLEKLPQDITLKDIQNFTEILLKSGMTIQEMNILRKKISMVKGGKLLNYVKCNGVCLVLSDVIGDDLRYIGSGPLYPEKDYISLKEILEKYKITEKIPEKIKKYLLKEEKEIVLKRKIPHFIIGNNLIFLKIIKDLLKEKLDIDAMILTDSLKGEAKEVAKAIISIGKFLKKALIFGGETTVTVRGNGKGGRNQEMVLSALLELKEERNFIFASIASDGIDGNSDAAGAIIDSNSIRKFKTLKLNPEKYLLNNDSYNFFKKIEDLVFTGSTGTNVLDATFIKID